MHLCDNMPYLLSFYPFIYSFSFLFFWFFFSYPSLLISSSSSHTILRLLILFFLHVYFKLFVVLQICILIIQIYIKFVKNQCWRKKVFIFYAGETHISNSKGFFEGAKPFLTHLGSKLCTGVTIRQNFLFHPFYIFLDLFFLLFSSHSFLLFNFYLFIFLIFLLLCLLILLVLFFLFLFFSSYV